MNFFNLFYNLYNNYLSIIYFSFLLTTLLYTCLYYLEIYRSKCFTIYLIGYTLLYFSLFYLYTLYIYFIFDQNFVTYQLIQTISVYNLHLNFGLDNLSLLFILLTAFIMPLCVILHYGSFTQHFFFNSKYSELLLKTKMKSSLMFLISLYGLFVILFVFFSTLDLFIMFVSFESSVIPLFLFISLYGSRIVNRLKASYYIFFFTTISSISFLFAIFFIFFTNGSLNLLFLTFNTYTEDVQCLIWMFLFIPIASKMPIVPLHLWLPEAHVEAPTEGSILLASLMLKLGAYFLLRFLIPIYTAGLHFFLPVIYTLIIISLLYTSCLIFLQTDLKKIIAYSSIAHMNLALLGLFSGNVQGVEGGLYMFFTHGVISSGLFMCIGWLYSRYHTRVVSYYSGLTYQLPLLSVLFFLFILGNLSFPGLGSFVSELLIIIGVFQKNLFLGVICLLSSFLCTLYSFLLYTRIFFGSSSTPYLLYKRLLLQDNASFINFDIFIGYKLSKFEFFSLFFLAIYTVLSGFFPNVYLNFLHTYSYYISAILIN